MRDSLRGAKKEIAEIGDREEIQRCIDRCALDSLDLDILRDVFIGHKSQIQISIERNVSVDTVNKRFRRAVFVLRKIAEKQKE